MQSTSTTPKSDTPRALLLAVQPQLQSNRDHLASCQELRALAFTLGIDTVHTHSQKRTRASLDTYVGAGSLDEVSDFINAPRGEDEDTSEQRVDLVIVNDSISPKLQRTLERAFGVEVMDRSAVILEIFEQRARTRQSRLEVEIARLRYELPRLRDDTTKRGREGGGGRGERGDTLVSMGKQRIRGRIHVLERDLEGIKRADHMRKRRRQEIFQVALVGYTNAGKSSLMRGLTGNEVLVEDKLFATLDTTVRQLSPATTPPVVVADTVGFIQDLPHELVASFRSTLEEACDANLVLLVLDASDPSWENHLEVTSTTLEDIGVQAARIRIVFNKCDALSEEERLALETDHPRALQTSAHDTRELAQLHQSILDIQTQSLSEERIHIPFDQGQLRAEVYAQGRVVEERHNAWGTVLRVRAAQAHLEKWHTDIAPSGAWLTEDILETCWNHDLGWDVVSDKRFQDDDGVLWDVRVLKTVEARTYQRRAQRVCRWLFGKLPVEVPSSITLTAGLCATRVLTGSVCVEVSDNVVSTLAEVLNTLWTLETQDAFEIGLPSVTMEEIRAQRVEMLDRVDKVLSIPPEKLHRWRRWLEVSRGWPITSVVLHADLKPEWFQRDDSGELVGIQGWGDARVGDPGEELLTLVENTGYGLGLLDELAKQGCTLWPEARRYVEQLRSFAVVEKAARVLASGRPGAELEAQALLR